VGHAAHDRGIGGRGVGEVDSDLGPVRCKIWKPEKNFSGCLLWVKLRRAHYERMLSVVSPMTDRSSHDHGTRVKPGPAASHLPGWGG
jgi:hypothetical protein